jgi:hypothetical protein
MIKNQIYNACFPEKYKFEITKNEKTNPQTNEKCQETHSNIARRRTARWRISAPRVGSARSKHEGRPLEAFDSLSGLSRARSISHSLSLSRTRRARGAQPLTSIRSAERSQTQSHASHVSDASSEESPSGRYRTRIGCRLSLARHAPAGRARRPGPARASPPPHGPRGRASHRRLVGSGLESASRLDRRAEARLWCGSDSSRATVISVCGTVSTPLYCVSRESRSQPDAPPFLRQTVSRAFESFTSFM